MMPQSHCSSSVPDLYSKGRIRMKFFNGGEDSDSTACSAVMRNEPKQKKQKTTSRAIDYTDPFTIPNLLEGIDSSKFGSVAKDIEALCARVLQRRKSYLSMNCALPFTYKDVEKSKGEEPAKLMNRQFNQPAHQIVIDLDDDDPVNDVKEVASPIIISDSDNEDSGDQMPYHQHKKDRNSAEIKAPREEVRSLAGEIDIRIDRVYVSTKNDMVIEERNHQTDIEDGEECDHSFVQKDLMDRDCAHIKASREEVGTLAGKIDTRIDKSVYVGTTNDVVIEKSNSQTDAKGGEECDHSFVRKDLMDRDSAETNAPREELGSLAGEIDIRIDKGVYVGSKNDMVIEEGNHQTDTENGEECHHSFVQKDLMIQVRDDTESKAPRKEVGSLASKIDIGMDKGVYVGAKDDMVTEEGNDQTDSGDDGLAGIWKEMSFALESSKDIVAVPSTDEQMKEDVKDCDHSFLLKEDLGYVCRICGVIQRGIETIFEFVYSKGKRTSRTYVSESQNTNNREPTKILPVGVESPGDDSEICAHPRHRKQMKPHQVEGFNFLCSNLVTDNPGGCILAHAPGSGKTFMIISFLQSFMAKFPRARPLIVLPKGILATWKKEFQIWQVEDFPLYDFYTSKAENRSQQLDVLKKWIEQKSILFLGYKQFSTIVCDNERSKVIADCQEILLKAPGILILDEGHTPRNEDTDVLQSLAKVETPLKVVLSGTLYQNRVREVFNILNLVRPKFIKLGTSQDIYKRIMSRVQITGVRKQLKPGADSAFFDLVEHTLQKDENFTRKLAVIQDLREMTNKVLHYYKGDFLDELPGLVDFTVILNLSATQKDEVEELRKLDKFKRISVGSALYIHPQLKYISEKYPATGDRSSFIDDEKIDEMLKKMNVRDGVKAKFFLNILGLCESTGEKLLVFSQYILPLKLLERLSVKVKGWSPEKELFMITGDSNSEHRERSMERFNSSPDAKVFFGSIKACGEGISLVGASRILILDVHLNPSVTRQAIGRAYRPGQKRKVYTYRLVAADSPEEEDHVICFRKELISKMWFEWNESCGHQDFAVKTVDVNECGDLFLESPSLREDVKVLYKR